MLRKLVLLAIGLPHCTSFIYCRHTIREFVEVYRSERDPQKIKQLIWAGKKNVEALEQLATLDNEKWLRL